MRARKSEGAIAAIAAILLAMTLGPVTIMSNAHDLFSFEETTRPLVINLAVGAIAFVLGLLLLRSVVAACLFGTGILALWQFWFVVEKVAAAVSTRHAVLVGALLCLAVAAIGAVIIGRMGPRARAVTALVTAVVFVAMLSVPVVSLARTTLYLAQNDEEDTPVLATLTATGQKPDIYHMVLDGYARADVLNELFGVDNSPFLDALRSRGFKVADGATANFNQTILSTTSLLDMNYLESAFKDADGNPKHLRSLVAHRFRSSATLDLLSRAGYRFDATPTIYAPLSVDWGEPVARRPLCAVTFFEDGYFMKTPMHLWCKYTGEDLGGYFRLSFAEAMTRGPVTSGPPVFQFRHVLSPHPPFILNAEGEPVEPRGPGWSPSDGSGFIHGDPQLREEYRAGYADQVQGLNRHLLRLVDNLLKSPRPKIIIMHGDHGSGLYHEQKRDKAERTCIWERFSPLLAVYAFDGRLQEAIPEDISLVNVYRALFSVYFGAEFPPLENRHYYLAFDDMFSPQPVSPTATCKAEPHAVAGK